MRKRTQSGGSTAQRCVKLSRSGRTSSRTQSESHFRSSWVSTRTMLVAVWACTWLRLPRSTFCAFFAMGKRGGGARLFGAHTQSHTLCDCTKVIPCVQIGRAGGGRAGERAGRLNKATNQQTKKQIRIYSAAIEQVIVHAPHQYRYTM